MYVPREKMPWHLYMDYNVHIYSKCWEKRHAWRLTLLYSHTGWCVLALVLSLLSSLSLCDFGKPANVFASNNANMFGMYYCEAYAWMTFISERATKQNCSKMWSNTHRSISTTYYKVKEAMKREKYQQQQQQRWRHQSKIITKAKVKQHGHQCAKHTAHTLDTLFAVVLMMPKTKDADYRNG